jgi:hypothetical protein
MKELKKGNMEIRCNKEFKSISPHSISYINEKNTKNVYEEARGLYFGQKTIFIPPPF